MVPEFLIVGHVTKDLLPDELYRLGGTTSYASVAMRNLGKRAAIVTSCAADMDLEAELPGVQIANKVSRYTTTFRNIYEGGFRHQYVLSTADPLNPVDVPASWTAAPIVLLGPLVREMTIDMVRLFPDALLGVTAQGWMRQWDDDGRVHARLWESASEILPLVDVLFFSYEDVDYDLERVKAYACLAPTAVVTHSRLGAVVYTDGRSEWMPAYRAQEVDPTGAGDVFASAYLLALHEQGDPFRAACFANCAASLSIEGEGISAMPNREQVEARWQKNDLVTDISAADREMIETVLI